MQDKPKIAIAMPTTGSVKTDTFVSVVRMLKDVPFDWQLITQTSSILHESRNILVNKAIELGCTHILFVDSDMKFDSNALDKLIVADKDIIGAMYNKKQFPACRFAWW